MATLKELRDVRLEKLNKLRELGLETYQVRSVKEHANGEIVANFEKYDGKVVTLAGRIMSWREHGALVFGDLQDESGRIQLYIAQELLAETSKVEQTLGFTELTLLDIGDFVQVTGKVTKTKRGEISLQPTKLTLLSKSLRPLPDKWEGIKDRETQLRKRYVDMLVDTDVKKILDIRWKMTQEIRKFLWSEGFTEVETPVLQPLYGGTNAKPFITHLNALDQDFYLRVAPELYLKRLMVGGYEKIFEIARNFRNEGIDQSHFPEFTMLEWYEAYADYNRVMDLTEAMTKQLVKEILGGTKIKVGEHEIDVGGKWTRVVIDDLVKEHLNVEWEKVTEDETKALQKKYAVEVRGTWTKNKSLFAIYDHVITPKLVNPTFVVDYPIEVSPLSREHPKKGGRVERFECYIGGVEIFDGWSEIVSGLEQRKRFEQEQANMREGDVEAMPLDEDFLEALEHGCPPLGGIGFGIDRLAMFLANTWAIKDVIAFPNLKPKG